jgi:hypothetical protein
VSAPIPLRDFVVSGLVSAETVNALLAFGQPMLSETPPEYGSDRHFRAWIRLRQGGRTFGHPWHSTPQFAAVALLEKLRAGAVSELLTIVVEAHTAQDAESEARRWAAAEPHIRLLALTRVRLSAWPDGTQRDDRWQVELRYRTVPDQIEARL